jgi:hypothetical protein
VRSALVNSIRKVKGGGSNKMECSADENKINET